MIESLQTDSKSPYFTGPADDERVGNFLTGINEIVTCFPWGCGDAAMDDRIFRSVVRPLDSFIRRTDVEMDDRLSALDTLREIACGSPVSSLLFSETVLILDRMRGSFLLGKIALEAGCVMRNVQGTHEDPVAKAFIRTLLRPKEQLALTFPNPNTLKGPLANCQPS